ncbi:MAG: hypothetical protein A3F91_00540 [Flavobacteria bacterium RIFCSPLOWO2_12_FULL_35_11]|nr:MAG: hypothetical protein A3F91_00540 [Flavobacteria bacterium RIFCSPLOWO2_12_FULL_35_11]
MDETRPGFVQSVYERTKENKVFVVVVCVLLLLAAYNYCSCTNPLQQARELVCGKEEKTD